MVAVKKDKINGDWLGTGRRKSAVARVRLRPGSGKVVVNGKPLDVFFPQHLRPRTTGDMVGPRARIVI